MHAFTSVTANYLPKAAVLAHTLKRQHPEVVFHLVLSDELPADCPRATLEAFDSIINIRDLPIERLPQWIFRHRLVELCTAVKGVAIRHLAEAHGADRVVYFDPDIAVLSRLDDLFGRLDHKSVLLTPHQTEPQEPDEIDAILDNEVCSLKHGVYNLGFLAVRTDTGEGRRFVNWWADRLLRLCYADIPSGLFTDQRWVDLAPAFFDDLQIVRDCRFNVATWNLSHRRATGTAPDHILINGRPLGFYHFSGFDSGAQEAMLGRYGSHSPALFALRDWYIAECEKYGQTLLGSRPCVYGRYSDGTPVPDAHRLLYRNRADLMAHFPDPYDARERGRSYLGWCLGPGASEVKSARPGVVAEPSPLVKLFKRHAPEPALKLARRARSALRRLRSVG